MLVYAFFVFGAFALLELVNGTYLRDFGLHLEMIFEGLVVIHLLGRYGRPQYPCRKGLPAGRVVEREIRPLWMEGPLSYGRIHNLNLDLSQGGNTHVVWALAFVLTMDY